MFCNNCGKKLPDESKFCYECGAKVFRGEEQTETASAPCETVQPKPLNSVSVFFRDDNQNKSIHNDTVQNEKNDDSVICIENGYLTRKTLPRCKKCGNVITKTYMGPSFCSNCGTSCELIETIIPLKEGQINPKILTRKIVSLIIGALIILLSFMPLFTVTDYKLFSHDYNIFEIETLVTDAEKNKSIIEWEKSIEYAKEHGYSHLPEKPYDVPSGEIKDTAKLITIIHILIICLDAFLFIYYLYHFSKPPIIKDGRILLDSVRFNSIFHIFLCIYLIALFYYLSPISREVTTTFSFSICSALILMLTITNIIINVVTRKMEVFINK